MKATEIAALTARIIPLLPASAKLPAEARATYGRYKVIPTALLCKAPWNYKVDDLQKARLLANNIKRNGLIANLQVRLLKSGMYEVIDGNHRLDAVIELGMEQVIAYDHGKIAEAAAMRIALELNETTFDAEQSRLAQLMKTIRAEYGTIDLAETLFYSEKEIDRLADLADENETQRIADVQPKNENDEFVTVLLHVPKATYEMWLAWQEKCLSVLGDAYSSQEKCFELAMVEANNVPAASLK